MSEHNICEVISIYTGGLLLLDTGNNVARDSGELELHQKAVEATLAQIALGEVPGEILDQEAQIFGPPLSS